MKTARILIPSLLTSALALAVPPARSQEDGDEIPPPPPAEAAAGGSGDVDAAADGGSADETEGSAESASSADSADSAETAETTGGAGSSEADDLDAPVIDDAAPLPATVVESEEPEPVDYTPDVAPERVTEAVPQVEPEEYQPGGDFRVERSGFGFGGLVSDVRQSPFSVSSLDADFLTEVQSDRLDSVANYVPGVQRGNQINNTSQVFVSRGFQLGRDSILINGSRQSDAFAITPQGLVSGIEFYRGPSSILNGQTPPGGAANIITKKPLPDPFREVGVTTDSHGKFHTNLDYNSGEGAILGVPASVRFNFVGEDSDTFRDHVEREVAAFAPAITIRPGPDTTMTFEYNYIDWEAPDDRGLPLLGGTTDEAAEIFDEETFLLGTTAEENDRETHRFFFDLSHEFNPSLVTNLQLLYGETVRSQFAIFPAAFDPTTNTLFRSHFGTEDRFNSVDVRWDTQWDFATGPISHQGQTGFQYRSFERRDLFTGFAAGADAVNVLDPDPNLPFQGFGPGRGLERDLQTLEPFLENRFRVEEGPLTGLQAVAGMRVIKFEDQLAPAQDQTETVGRFALGYTPPFADQVTVYSQYGESFDPTGAVDAAGNPLPPETGEQWEYGAKADLLDDRLTVSAAYFRLQNSNVAVQDPNGMPGDQIAIGGQENDGFEFEAVGRLTDRWQLRGQYTRNATEITNDILRRGNELALAPEDSASLWLQFRTDRFASPWIDGTSDRLTLGGGVVFVDDRFATVDNAITLTEYTRVDLFAGYELGERTDIRVNLRNVGDERFFVGGNTFGGSVLPGQPFGAVFEVTHRF